MMDNIHKLVALQDAGDIPPAAEDTIALLFAERYALELRYVAAWGCLAELRRHALGPRQHPARVRSCARDLPRGGGRLREGRQRGRIRKDRRRRRAAGQGGSPPGRHRHRNGTPDGWVFNTGEDDDGSRDV